MDPTDRDKTEPSKGQTPEWNPVGGVERKVKKILVELRPAVSVQPERTLDDLSLASDTVRLKMNTAFFSASPNRLSAEQVKGTTSVLTLIQEIKDLGGTA